MSRSHLLCVHGEDAPLTHVALAVARLLAGGTLFVESGWPKLLHLPALLAGRVDPLHLGVLAPLAMLYAALALGPGALLVVVGLACRWAALLVVISLAGTFFGIDHVLLVNLLDPGHNTHPEVIGLYLATMAMLALSGPGRYSLDGILTGQSCVRPPASARKGV